jgi:PhnB protein
MNTTIEFQKSVENKQIIVKHSYQHPLETIWNAYIKTEILEKWWVPEPYKAIVVTNNFEKGKYMHYYMLSPEGQKHYCIAEFLEIAPLKSYKVLDAFCDENAVINTEFPRMKWLNRFSFENGITTVTNTITFEKTEDMTQILEMGFEEGYKMGLNQLHRLLNQK